MSLRPEALTTLANLKEQLDITDTSQDSRLEQVINRVTAWLETQTNRKLKARNYNGGGTAFSGTTVASEDYLYFDGRSSDVNERGQGVLYLPVPVVRPSAGGSAFELAVLTDRQTGADGAGDTWSTTDLLEGRDYLVDYKTGTVTKLSGTFTTGYRNYRVKCTGGYYDVNGPAKVPQDLEALCLELCKQMHRESGNVQSESIGTWSRVYKPEPDSFQKEAIAQFSLLSL